MLSQDDRRRLVDIERWLERDDPNFAAWMRDPVRVERRRRIVRTAYVVAWLAIPPLLGVTNWRVVAAIAAILVLVPSGYWAMRRYRRGRPERSRRAR